VREKRRDSSREEHQSFSHGDGSTKSWLRDRGTILLSASGALLSYLRHCRRLRPLARRLVIGALRVWSRLSTSPLVTRALGRHVILASLGEWESNKWAAAKKNAAEGTRGEKMISIWGSDWLFHL